MRKMIKGDGEIKFLGSERDFRYVSVRKRGVLDRVVGRVTGLFRRHRRRHCH